MRREKDERNYARRYAHEYHILRAGFQVFAVCIAYPFLKIVYGIKAIGRKNLPKKGKYIYAANHVSMFDPLLVSYAVRRPIVYIAKKELFEDEKLAWWIKRLGALPVNREKPEIATFKTVKEVFKTSWSLAIFPQGGIRENHKIENIQKGFAVIAKYAQADIIPVSIYDFEGYTKTPFSQNVKIVIGKPISHKLSNKEIIEQWAKQICENSGFENCMQQEEKVEEVALQS